MMNTNQPEIWDNIRPHPTAPKIHDIFVNKEPHSGHTHVVVYHRYFGTSLKNHLNKHDHSELIRVLSDVVCALEFYADASIVPVLDNAVVLNGGQVMFTSHQVIEENLSLVAPEDLLNPKHGNWCPVEAFRKRHAWHIGQIALDWLAARHGNMNHQKDAQLLSLYRSDLNEEDEKLLVIIERCLVVDPVKRISLVDLKVAMTGGSC